MPDDDDDELDPTAEIDPNERPGEYDDGPMLPPFDPIELKSRKPQRRKTMRRGRSLRIGVTRYNKRL